MSAHYWVIDDVLAGRAGPRCVPWDLQEIREAGVGGVVSLDANVDVKAFADAKLKHLPAYVPMVLLETEEDHLEFLALMPNIVRFIDDIRASGEAALVHCHYGCDRTGCVLGCYLVAREGIDPYAAYQLIKTRNPYAFGATGYAEAILTFDKVLKQYPQWLELTT